MGTRPWSEDLLDELAIHLSDSKYDVKQTLALIATSRVYSMRSTAIDETASPEDYVFVGPAPKRMTAEEFCDALSAVTGVAPDKTAKDDIFVELAKKAQSSRPFVRSSLVVSTPLMRTLGRPNRELVVTTRPADVTTLEAIELSNGQALTELLLAGAEKLLAEHQDATPEKMCERIFKAALSREPSQEEMARMLELAGERLSTERVADVLWCVAMLPEFQLVR
jgi:hypothetical protein